MATQKALETLCYVNGCGSVAIKSAQIHVETGGAVARQLLDAPSLYYIVLYRTIPNSIRYNMAGYLE